MKFNHNLGKKLQIHYMDTDNDNFVLSIKTNVVVEDLQNLKTLFNFSSRDKTQGMFSNKNEKVLEKFERKTPKNNWTDEFILLRIKGSHLIVRTIIKKTERFFQVSIESKVWWVLQLLISRRISKKMW